MRRTKLTRELEALNQALRKEIAERKQVEAALRESERRFREMISALPVAICVCDPNGLITHYNSLAAQLWGREPILGDPAERYSGAHRLYHFDGTILPHTETLVHEVLQTGIASHNMEVIIERPNGSRVTALVSVAPLHNEQGQLIGAIKCFQDITERKNTEEQRARLFAGLRASREQLQRLSHQLLRAYESERGLIARELHDQFGQQLTGLGLLLTAISQHLPSDINQAPLIEAQAHIRELMIQVRNFALDLRPAMLDDLGLVPALVWLFERYTTQTTIAIRFEHLLDDEQRFEMGVETAAYRIVQEALTNVARHANVSEVIVRLWTDDESLFVVIVDQGRGFNQQALRPHEANGLAGMAERAALLGGHLAIDSNVGSGTRLTVNLPLYSGTEPHTTIY